MRNGSIIYNLVQLGFKRIVEMRHTVALLIACCSLIGFCGCGDKALVTQESDIVGVWSAEWVGKDKETRVDYWRFYSNGRFLMCNICQIGAYDVDSETLSLHRESPFLGTVHYQITENTSSLKSLLLEDGTELQLRRSSARDVPVWCETCQESRR